MELLFYREILEKFSCIKCENSFWRRVVLFRPTETYRHDEAKSRFSQFCEGA